MSRSDSIAVISFTIEAPFSSACLATSDLVVSIEIGTLILFDSFLITGIVLFISSSIVTGPAPGLVAAEGSGRTHPDPEKRYWYGSGHRS